MASSLLRNSTLITKALIIPAAGAGSRMNRKTPKPYLELSGQSILKHTIRRFFSLKGLTQIIVATSPAFMEKTRWLLEEVPHTITTLAVKGGEERQHTVYHALGRVSEVDLVLVHDAVRPFVQLKQIEACCRAAWEHGAAALGVPVRDTIKRIDGRFFVQETPERKRLWKAQTPQVFKKNLLLEAYEKAMRERYIGTDDASFVENIGQAVKMVEGDHSNYKITYPLDLRLARLQIKEKNG